MNDSNRKQKETRYLTLIETATKNWIDWQRNSVVVHWFPSKKYFLTINQVSTSKLKSLKTHMKQIHLKYSINSFISSLKLKKPILFEEYFCDAQSMTNLESPRTCKRLNPFNISTCKRNHRERFLPWYFFLFPLYFLVLWLTDNFGTRLL